MRTVLFVLLLLGATGCRRAETPEMGDLSDRQAPELAISTRELDPIARARLVTGLQRELFSKLGDPTQDPATLLMRDVMLIDRADTLALKNRGSLAPVARQDDYLALLAGRLPPRELVSDRFDLYQQEEGSIVVVSHLADDRMNMTVWIGDGDSWKARAIIVNPARTELDWLAQNARPLMAGSPTH